MNANRSPYPIFDATDNVEAWEKLLARAIPLMNPLYFAANPRFKGLGPVTHAELLDYLGVYDEGDWWVLTIIATTDTNGQVHHIFLPLTTKERASDSDIAFGVETVSAFHGKRSWKIIDAFGEQAFIFKLLHLFETWEHVPEDHSNACTAFHEGEAGKFVFHAPGSFQMNQLSHMSASIEITASGELRLTYADRYRLEILGILMEPNAGTEFSISGAIGTIAYHQEGMPALLIGRLEEITTAKRRRKPSAP